ncbi:adenylate/guanylate cyclase domain-containing protein [Candidatus Albibeggiatoa sp. nov. NOAA]|uniref:adenylate/guanylate cyclase domain-containing protein n=1 Tax=Candidatus Albibeggiatoa sp. nov. NOAA TaxID=3162724 RepID=UPI003304A32E|nr:adenylate/guanylate cyclase domain-containing protein [Thiotrichaceae bacterium]
MITQRFWPFKSAQNSIAAKIIRMTFSIYFVLAIILTTIHMVSEYYRVQDTIVDDMKIIQKTLGSGIAKIIWDIDLENLDTMLKGIYDSPVVVGVKLETDMLGEMVIGNVIGNDGKYLAYDRNGEPLEKSESMATLFNHTFPLVFTEGDDVEQVGSLSLYSSSDIVFQHVKLGFTFIVVNAFLKTLLLWVILYIIILHLLSRPLKILTEETSRIDLNTLDNASIDIQTCDEKTELKVLEKSFNAMLQKLKAAKEELVLKNRLIAKTSKAYSRFFPPNFLLHLNKDNITDLELGDSIQQDISILFSDIRSFTSISEKMTPDENFRFLNSYFGAVVPAISENHGFVDKYIGDGIMALFSGDKDHAVQAGIDIYKQLDEYNLKRIEAGDFPIHIGTAIHSGDVMLGTIGEKKYMETTAIGDTVNLASRLEGMTKMYGVKLIISEAVWRSLKNPDNFYIRLIDVVKAKGKNEPVSIYEVYNFDSPEIIKLKSSTKNVLEEGLALYQNKKFVDAKQRFEYCLTIFEDDSVAKVHLEHCISCLTTSPSSDWDGIKSFDTK